MPEIVPRYNVAPTQQVGIVRRADGQREFVFMRWGLVPMWAKDPSIGSRLINARSETAAEKPAFRDAFKRRRSWS
jgi:putative SOS response-associated peptidase YedK